MSTFAALAGGLLSHIDEREMPCATDGCRGTWLWTAIDQIQAYGQSPPRRLCDECRYVSDAEVACCVEGCKRSWFWSRDAQLKHRGWIKRQGDEGPVQRGKRGRRKRNDGPPRRKCEPCQKKLNLLEERSSVCKVHGCTREVTLDRELQLKAWASLGTEDLNADFTLPKRMCEVCREFCRMHPDREVACGRPECTRTWTYKTGAQLQAFLAGRLEDPVRLCTECIHGGYQSPDQAETDVEVMPCVLPGCDGTWQWWPGLNIAAAKEGDRPVDRMCAEHRAAYGAPAPVDPPSLGAGDAALDEELTNEALGEDLEPDEGEAAVNEATTSEGPANEVSSETPMSERPTDPLGTEGFPSEDKATEE